MHIRNPLSHKWAPRELKNGAIVELSTINVTIEDRETHVDVASDVEGAGQPHRIVRLEIGDFFSVDVPYEGPLAEVNSVHAAATIAIARARIFLNDLSDRVYPLLDQAAAALVAGSR